MSKRSDLALRHLAQVVESSDDAIVSKDLDGTIISWNRAAERMFGYTAAEAIGRSIRIVIPADRQAEEDTVLATIRAGRAVSHFETIRQRKDGSLLPISLTVSPIRDEAGTIVGASKIARDITPQLEAAIVGERLAAVIASSDDAIITKDLTGTITSWNPAAERMFGYTDTEAIGRSVRMLIPDELQGEEDVVLARLRAGYSIDHYETVRCRKDGARISISLTVSPIRDTSGAVVGASKIARDVTESTRLRAAARDHAEITQKLSEVGARVASTLDRDVVVQQVTDAATELTTAAFGAFFYNVVDAESGNAYMLYTLSGAPKAAFSQFPHPRATAIFAPTFHGVGPVRLADVTQDPRFGQNPPFRGMPPGHLPVRSYLAVPVRGVRTEVLGGLFFGHPEPGRFTEQHERIAVGIAGWASVALENARLFVEAQDANRMKDEFLAVLSHELRTPLNAIVGYARLLRGGMLVGEKAERGLETLERNARWLTQIVEDVLDVSRIVSGKIRLDVQPVHLPLVIDNAVATVQPAADAKGVRVQAIADSSVGPVSGDPDRLQQVVWNLLANAVKFTGRGGRVQIRLERVNSHVEIVVSDTGEGIAPSFLPYVFERFRQADAAITRKTGGLGLGLAIVRHIVEMHGGRGRGRQRGRGEGRDLPGPAAADDRARWGVAGTPRASAHRARRCPGQPRRPPRDPRRGHRRRKRCADAAAHRLGDRRGGGLYFHVGDGGAGRPGGREARRADRRHRHARDGRLRVHLQAARVARRDRPQPAGGGADGFRALRGSHPGAAQRLRDAPGQAGRSGRARRLGRDPGPPHPPVVVRRGGGLSRR